MTAQKNKSKSGDSTTSHNSDFSIEHILNRAGSSCSDSEANLSLNISDSSTTNSSVSIDTYTWLHCTRYCPPKIPRTQRRCGPQKRQLGRHPRIPFTSHQLSVLEEKFQQSPYLSSEEVILLARQLQLADIRVKIWFQNRRARERREKSHHVNRSNLEAVNEINPTTSNSLSSSPIPQVLNLIPAQTLLQSHLTEYLLPVNNQI